MNRRKGRDNLLSPAQQQWQNLERDPLIGLRPAAQALNISVDTLRRMVRQKRVLACRVAGRIKLRQSVVLGLVKDYEREI